MRAFLKKAWRGALGSAALTFLLLALAPAAFSQLVPNFVDLHDFAAGEGSSPQAALIQTSDGTLFGTTTSGGDNDNGTIFQVDSTGVLKTLYSFPALANDVTNSTGAFPMGSLVQGSDGKFYTTASIGGSGSGGTVVAMDISGASPVVSTLLNFAAFDGNGENTGGAVPKAGLIPVTGGLLGLTSRGGASGGGTFFSVSLPGQQTKSTADLSSSIGSDSIASLTAAPNDVQYGVCSQGGPNGGGSVFMINFFVGLFARFDSVDASGHSATGTQPASPVVQSADGLFWGTTRLGGAFGSGVVYLVPTQSVIPTVVHSFDTLEAGNINADGAEPNGLVFAPDGNFYGTTSSGGPNGTGTIFQVTPKDVYTVLHAFPAVDGSQSNQGGAIPQAALVLTKDNTFAGTTQFGGANGRGTVFSFSMTPAITSNLDVQAADGVPFSYQIVATNNPTSYSASGLPPGLVCDPNTGLISGTPPVASPTRTSPLSIANVFGTTTATLTISVVDPPSITVGGPVTGEIGMPFTYSISATNPPETFSAAGLPDGLTLAASSGVISGTPTTAGSFNVMLTVTNAAGSAKATLPITITPAIPTVTLKATVPVASISNGTPAVYVVSLSSAQTVPVVVGYALKGSAENGVDYVMLSGQKKIKPGKTSKPIQIVPMGDLGGADKKTVKMVLLHNDVVYSVGTAGKVKVSIEP